MQFTAWQKFLFHFSNRFYFQSYPENPVEFRPLTESDLQKIRHEKRQKESQRRQKISDCRRHLAAIRVLQKNLVFVVGISQRLSDAEVCSICKIISSLIAFSYNFSATHFKDTVVGVWCCLAQYSV